MLCGVIAMAAGTAEALAYPDQVLPVSARVALGCGAVLFVCGTAAAIWRATGRILVSRWALAIACAVAVVTAGELPWVAMAVLLAMLVTVSVVEEGRTARADPTAL